MEFSPAGSRIWSHERLIPYPFQINLGWLPTDVVVECILGMVDARCERSPRPVKTFEDYVLRTMGAGIAKHFMFPYNEKIWKIHPRDMTTDWIGRFVPEPEFEQALRSALRRQRFFGGDITRAFSIRGLAAS